VPLTERIVPVDAQQKIVNPQPSEGRKGRRMSHIGWDAQKSPLLVCRFPSEWTDQEFENGMVELLDILAKAERVGLVSDTTGSGKPTAKQRRFTADSIARNEELFRTRVAGWAVVVDSPVVRGIVTAITWIHSPPFPLIMLPTVREAEEWVRTQLSIPASQADADAGRAKTT
jgi:hypothetical protein